MSEVKLIKLDTVLDALREALAPQLEQQRAEWEREGPAAEARAAEMGITFKSKGGNCPVQAEGTFNGNEFYFRARGDGWQFHVGPDAERFGPDEYVAEGGYGEGFDAGWMPLHVAIAIICAQVERYRAAQEVSHD